MYSRNFIQNNVQTKHKNQIYKITGVEKLFKVPLLPVIPTQCATVLYTAKIWEEKNAHMKSHEVT